MARGPVSTARFVRMLRLVTAAAFLPTGFAIVHLLVPVGLAPAILVAIVTAAALLLPLDVRTQFGFRDTRRPRWIGAWAVPLFDLFWTAVLLSPVTTFLLGAAFAVARLSGAPPVTFGKICALGVASAVVVAGYGVFVRRRWTRRRRIEIPIGGLPPSFDGYRIVHLSDLHVGSITSRREALGWSHAANETEPDLVAITGDVLTTGVAFHDDVVEVLAALRARDGVFAVLGNHDYYEEDRLCRALAARDVRVLRNEGVAIARGDGHLFVAGVEDLWRGRPDLAAALARKPAEAPVVLLAHNPEYFPTAHEAGVGLTLAGHTHAGQIAVPFLVERAGLAHFSTRFAAGLHARGEARLFVHAGLGTTGPAIRIGAAPELVEIVLRAPR
jgi:predicted MPP superfamily phosphohydrolase